MLPLSASPPKSGISYPINFACFLLRRYDSLSDTIFLVVLCRSASFIFNFYDNSTVKQPLLLFLRKEVIQPHLPIRLPCYDFTPVIIPAFGGSLLAVGSPTSGIYDSHGVTGGVYKTRERIHRDILIRDY